MLGVAKKAGSDLVSCCARVELPSAAGAVCDGHQHRGSRVWGVKMRYGWKVKKWNITGRTKHLAQRVVKAIKTTEKPRPSWILVGAGCSSATCGSGYVPRWCCPLLLCVLSQCWMWLTEHVAGCFSRPIPLGEIGGWSNFTLFTEGLPQNWNQRSDSLF